MLCLVSRLAGACLVVALAAPPAWADKKKKKEQEEITQTLEVLPDPPATIKAEVGKMVFHTAPLTGKGLLSQQVKDSIKAIWRLNQGATVVKLRALVAGTGDMRRVNAIVSEMFTEKRQPLPVVSTIQVGGLPMEGAQVILEAISTGKRAANPDGLAFISGKGASAPINPDQPNLRVTPLVMQAMQDMRKALDGVQLTTADVLRMTCFVSSLEDGIEARQLLAREYPKATLTYAQTQRSPERSVAECEAVARLKSAAGDRWKVVNPPGLRTSPAFSQLAVAGAGPVVLTGTQLAFRTQDGDVRLAFERLGGQLEQSGTSMKNVFWSGIYALSRTVTEKIRNLRFDYYDKANPPASTLMQFEGLPSLDASFAVEVIAGLP
jgi:enamine deaminase RidA (YjgF/YER057c/UK114 family)